MTIHLQSSPRADLSPATPERDDPVELIEYSSPIGWSIVYGSLTPSGFVRLRFQGQEVIGSATGNGNVDALFKAMMNAARQLCVFPNGDLPKLEDWDVRSSGVGSDAPGVATVVMTYRSRQVTVRRHHANAVHASMTAFKASLNDLVRQTANDAPPVVPPAAQAAESGPEGSD